MALEEILADRLRKIKRIKELGIDPYPECEVGGQSIASARCLDVGADVIVRGRILRLRDLGKIAFFELRDQSGVIQVVVDRGSFTQEFKQTLSILDRGDFVKVLGVRYDTARGEVSVLAHSIEILAKSVRPLPDMHFGLQDTETRLRKRYLDFLLDDEVANLVRLRHSFWKSCREFFWRYDFLEVQTPALEVSAGGALARPFSAHHNDFDIDVYLRISMGELWQKKLLVGGFERVFELGRQFRNEGTSNEHLQEYEQLEFYAAYMSLEDGMKLVRDLFVFLATSTFGRTGFSMNGFDVDFSSEWLLLDYREVFKSFSGVDPFSSGIDEIRSFLEGRAQVVPATVDEGIDQIWKLCRKTIGGPAFLINEPSRLSPLAKRNPANPELARRIHVVAGGSEIGNGYSELNDPFLQRQYFEAQAEEAAAGNAEAHPVDDDYIEALEYGMPPAFGFGFSERVFSFMLGKPIRECQLFPLMRPLGAF